MTKFKLIYFPIRNLGEGIRLTFRYANVAFEDFHIPFEKWGTEYKKKTPYGTVPVLEIDGCELCESGTILRYLGRKFGLTRTPVEEAKVDELIQVHLSEYGKIKPWILAAAGFEKDADVPHLYETVAKPTAQFYFSIWSQILKDNGTGFLVGNHPTPADFFLADYFQTVLKLGPQLFDKFSDLKHYTDRIFALPQLQKYLNSKERLNAPF